MTDVRIEGDQLVVEMTGLDRFWALTRRLTIPLAHVRGATADPGVTRPLVRNRGTYLPGVITAGAFLRGREREFWNVRKLSNAVVIELQDESFARLVLDSPDPRGLADRIEHAPSA